MNKPMIAVITYVRGKDPDVRQLIAVLVGWIMIRPFILGMSLSFLAMLSTAVGAIILRKCIRRWGFWSLPSTSVTLLILFHLGALPELIFSGNSSLLWVDRWIHEKNAMSAIWIATLGVASFALGNLWRSRPTPLSHLSAPDTPGSEEWLKQTRRLSAKGIVGLLLLVAGLGLWLAFFVRAGLSINASYAEYLKAVSGVPLNVYYALMGVGLILTAGAPRRISVTALALFLGFGVIGFPLGVRGEILFPLAAWVVSGAAGLRLPRIGRTVATAVVLLAASAAVSALRTEGFWSSGPLEILQSLSPMRGLAELGLSLRPLYYVYTWHADEGMAFGFGSSYYAPFFYFVLATLGMRKQAQEFVPMFFDTIIKEGIGPIGGSIIAEAYHNFASVGVAGLLFVTGMLLARPAVTAAGRGSLFASVTGALALLFGTIVRNSFSNIPVLLVICVVGIGLTLVLRWLPNVLLDVFVTRGDLDEIASGQLLPGPINRGLNSAEAGAIRFAKSVVALSKSGWSELARTESLDAVMQESELSSKPAAADQLKGSRKGLSGEAE